MEGKWKDLEEILLPSERTEQAEMYRRAGASPRLARRPRRSAVDTHLAPSLFAFQ